MSRSRKHFPAGKNDLGSQKPGKKICHRLFRQRESMALRTGFLHDLPYRMWQIIDP